ncbi:MAG: hypothetical protein IKN57_11000, partial [Parasporobacterium sp.]|nr:hypothetical protein [Parasporobacterium sp.]
GFDEDDYTEIGRKQISLINVYDLENSNFEIRQVTDPEGRLLKINHNYRYYVFYKDYISGSQYSGILYCLFREKVTYAAQCFIKMRNLNRPSARIEKSLPGGKAKSFLYNSKNGSISDDEKLKKSFGYNIMTIGDQCRWEGEICVKDPITLKAVEEYLNRGKPSFWRNSSQT